MPAGASSAENGGPMVPLLRLVLAFAVLGAPLRAARSPPEVTPIIRFADPADVARITVAKADLSRVTGTRVNAGGIAARVDFELADWPELLIRPAEEPADWSGVQALAIPVDNPTAEPIDLVVRVDDDPNADGEHHSLSGRARVRSGGAGVLILPLPTNDALPMGMVAGPPPEAPRIDTLVQIIRGARGAVDRRHVTAIHLILLKRSLGRTLIFGNLGIIHGADPGPETYQSIVDAFGQYARAQWDGKIGSNDQLESARQREDQELREWLPPPLALDRYGGLLDGPVFGATGFFRTERRDDRWWLVTPDGHGFFSLGIDVVGPDIGATFVEGREFMFAELPDLSDPLATHYGLCGRTRELAQRARPTLRPRAQFRLLRGQSAAKIRARLSAALAPHGGRAAARLGLQYDWQLERASLARTPRAGLCRAHPHLWNRRKFRETRQRVGQVARSVRSGVHCRRRCRRGKGGLSLSRRPLSDWLFRRQRVGLGSRQRRGPAAALWTGNRGTAGRGSQPGKAGLCCSARREISRCRPSCRGVGYCRACVG